MTAPLSIVVINYNYAAFLTACLESVLAQTVACEVIVSDDGSTDASREIIERYIPRGVIALFNEHGGQIAAVNAGFAAAHGDIVLFLDADDLLYPTAAEQIVTRWYDGVAKVQFKLRAVDQQGDSLNYEFPTFPTDSGPATIRRQVLTTGHYFWPPCSGNAYARSFLGHVMPFSTDRFTNATDGLLNAVAPLYGDVLTIDTVLGCYRIHPLSKQHSVPIGPRVQENLSLMRRETNFLYEHACRLGIVVAEGFFDEMRQLELRMAVLLVLPEGKIAGDTRWSLLRTMLKRRAGDSWIRRTGRMGWMVAAALMPRPLRATMVQLRYEPQSRSSVLSKLLEIVRR